MWVAEAMDRPAWTEHAVARRQIPDNAIDRVSECTGQPVDAFFVVRVTVRRWNMRASGHSQLEYAHFAFVGTIDKIPDRQFTHLHDVARSHIA